MRITGDQRDELFRRIRHDDNLTARELFDDLCDDAELHGLGVRIEEANGLLGQLAADSTGTLAQLTEAVQELKSGSGAGGWVGTLDRETAAAVVKAQELTEVLRRAVAATDWVKDLREARGVVDDAAKSVRFLNEERERMSDGMKELKKMMTDAARAAQKAANIALEATAPKEPPP